MNGRLRPAALAAGLLLALAGLAFAAAASASQGTDLRAERALELRGLVEQRSERVERLESTVADLQQDVDDLLAQQDPVVADLDRDVQSLRSAAGLTPVQGRALRVTLDDAPLRDPGDPLAATLTPNDLIVHQSDVDAVINALWRGGAKAVQVMDQRIIGTSSVQCVGSTLLLQGRVYSPPYIITAVGPVRAMRESLWRDEAVANYRAWADAVGLGYRLDRLADHTAPAFEGPVAPASAIVPPGEST
jgi:uncharacterized protein YlxW (UPF0749 family)